MHYFKYDPETIDTMNMNFYIIRLFSELGDLLRYGGFQPIKWISNSREVLKQIPEADHVKSIDLNEH